MFTVNPKRIKVLRNSDQKKNGPVIYWMSRDQRISDNWSLLFALQKAKELNRSLLIAFCLVPDFLNSAKAQYTFMLKGLEQTCQKALKLNIPFLLLFGDPPTELAKLCREKQACSLVTDFDPLRIKQSWHKEIQKQLELNFYEVDSHNIIPCRLASTKQEFAAHTLRSKIHRQLHEFLEKFPVIHKQQSWTGLEHKQPDWNKAMKTISANEFVYAHPKFKPGEEAAFKMLQTFLNKRLPVYSEKRNDPNVECLSNLSPYLHFGQVSAQRVALETDRITMFQKSRLAFLEELLIRRELSDNFVFYNSSYDQFSGLPEWAQKTLNKHRQDKREFVYSQEQWEKANTHDQLWNAAQLEMVSTGKMHGYLRMYWAKKILEWSESPEKAISIASYLNDKYELDGRDPNGYTGIMWSIGGLHDRAWTERSVYGKIRYMNERGCRRKFNVDTYINKIRNILNLTH